MTDDEALAGRFERARPRLHAVAVRMLGEPRRRRRRGAGGVAATAPQRARRHRQPRRLADHRGVADLPRHPQVRLRPDVSTPSTRCRRPSTPASRIPAEQAVTADAVGAALLVVLDQLGPTERLAFVLHDLFGVPFDEVAPIVGTSPANARQLASRARRKVRGGESEPDRRRQREVVDAFLEAAREGRFERLLTMLDPDIELRADAFSVSAAATRRHLGAPALDPVMHGREAVAEVFSGRAAAAQAAYVDGLPAAVWAPGGTTRSAWVLTIGDGVITRVEMLGDPATLAGLEVELV